MMNSREKREGGEEILRNHSGGSFTSFSFPICRGTFAGTSRKGVKRRMCEVCGLVLVAYGPGGTYRGNP